MCRFLFVVVLFPFYYNPNKIQTPSSLNHGFTDTWESNKPKIHFNFLFLWCVLKFYVCTTSFVYRKNQFFFFAKQKQSFSCRYTQISIKNSNSVCKVFFSGLFKFFLFLLQFVTAKMYKMVALSIWLLTIYSNTHLVIKWYNIPTNYTSNSFQVNAWTSFIIIHIFSLKIQIHKSISFLFLILCFVNI